MMGRVSMGALLLAMGFAGVALAQETAFQAETRFVTQTLPCKYVSMGGRTGPSYGAGHYDFACKGGTWGTVTLLLDNKTLGNAALDSVRLAYRSWDPAVNPTAGEAAVAEQFLQTLLNRYVPAADAPKVRQAFWGQRKASFKTGKTTSRLWQEEGQGYITQWLEIKAPALGSASTGLSMAPAPMASKPVQPLIGWAIPSQVQATTPIDAGLLQPTQPQPTFTPALPQQPLNLPVPGSATPAASQPGLQVPANAPASAKNRGAAPKSLMETLGSTARSILGLPAAPSPTSPLPSVANPASLNTAPAPESLTKPTPPPAISTSLVPAPEMVVGGRAPAPTNFAAYTEAERLTKDIEEKALGTAQKAMQSASGAMAVSASTPSGTPAPSLPAVPLPTITPTDAGLLKTPTAPPASEPRFTPQRDLPQLKFIPKAEPLNTQNDVIRFEDEGSGL